MKNIVLASIFIIVLVTQSVSQSIELNEKTNIYEFSHVEEFKGSIDDRLNLFIDRLKDLNYSNINQNERDIKAESFFVKVIFGSAMEVHYNVLISLKEGRYKLKINNFTINDVRYGEYILEDIKKSSQKRWVKFINEKLPKEIENIERDEIEEEW